MPMSEMSKEYATALFTLGCEMGEEEAFAAGLDTLVASLRENPLYLELLASPGIPKDERTGALAAAFSDALPETVLSFAQLLCEHGRIREVFDCADEYCALLRGARRRSVARVISAAPLDEGQRERLQAALEKKTGCTVSITYETDPGLLGGMTVEIGDTVLDGSLKTRLREVKEVMSQ